MKREKLSTVFTGILVFCALVITGLVVKRNLYPNKGSGTSGKTRKVQMVSHWQRFEKKGHYYVGDKNAPVQIIEFFDFQCPFCYNCEQTLSLIKEDYPNKVAVVAINYPLQMHPYAYPAAIAAECAAQQHHYNQYHDLLFKNHRRLKHVHWDRLVTKANVESIGRFRRCINNEKPKSAIKGEKNAAKRIGVDATPTVMVNGKLVAGALNYKELDNMIQAVLKAK